MAGKKDRDYDAILKELKEMEKNLEALKTDAKRLDIVADSSGATLNDKVAEKDLKQMKALAESIRKAAAQGEERIRELIRTVTVEKREFEELSR